MTLGELKEQIDALLAERPALALSPVEHYRERANRKDGFTRDDVRRVVTGVAVLTPWGGVANVVAIKAGWKVF